MYEIFLQEYHEKQRQMQQNTENFMGEDGLEKFQGNSKTITDTVNEKSV